jgi:hypothetical protein
MMMDPTNESTIQKSKLFVGQLPRDINEEVLRIYFEPFGAIREISIIRDPLSGISRGINIKLLSLFIEIGLCLFRLCFCNIFREILRTLCCGKFT